MLKRGAGDGHQRVDGDGVDAELCKADRHVQAVFPRFTHADDAAGTGAHALRLDLFQSLHLHVVGVGGADVREVPLRGLNVVVIARDARLVQPVKLLGAQKAHGRAQVDLALAVHRLISVDRLIEFLAGQGSPRGDDREAVHALAFVHLAGL